MNGRACNPPAVPRATCMRRRTPRSPSNASRIPTEYQQSESLLRRVRRLIHRLKWKSDPHGVDDRRGAGSSVKSSANTTMPSIRSCMGAHPRGGVAGAVSSANETRKLFAVAFLADPRLDS
jgi:hypothetical protein